MPNNTDLIDTGNATPSEVELEDATSVDFSTLINIEGTEAVADAQVETDKYLGSTLIKVFPSGFRQAKYDINASRSTEESLTKMIKTAWSYGSFVKEDGSNLNIVINGYVFSCTKNDLTSLFSQATKIYAQVKVLPQTINNDSNKLNMLVNYDDESQDLDVTNTNSGTDFKGIMFSNQEGGLLVLQKINDSWEVPKSSKLILSSHNISNGVDLNPISSEFTTDVFRSQTAVIGSTLVASSANLSNLYGGQATFTDKLEFGNSSLGAEVNSSSFNVNGLNVNVNSPSKDVNISSSHFTLNTTNPADINGVKFIGGSNPMINMSSLSSSINLVNGWAQKATQDESGNNIKSSYASSLNITESGTKNFYISLLNKNGATLSSQNIQLPRSGLGYFGYSADGANDFDYLAPMNIPTVAPNSTITVYAGSMIILNILGFETSERGAIVVTDGSLDSSLWGTNHPLTESLVKTILSKSNVLGFTTGNFGYWGKQVLSLSICYYAETNTTLHIYGNKLDNVRAYYHNIKRV